MIKKLTLFILAVMLTGILQAQVTPPTLGTGERWTNLWSLSYDYQTNGSVRYIIQDPTDPNKLCAILMATLDSTSAAGTNRYIYFSYSSNCGTTWDAQLPITTSFASGFPCLTNTAGGQPTVAFHMAASPTSAQVWQDLIFGAGTWSQTGVMPNTPENMVWPHMAVTTNGNMLVAANVNPIGTAGNWSYYNGTTWSAQGQLPLASGPSGNFSVEAGPNGAAFVFGSDYNLTAEPTSLYLSTNNGQTLTIQTGANAPPAYIFNGSDTLCAFLTGGKDGLYVGNEIHLVYTIYSTTSEGGANLGDVFWAKQNKIVHWSPSTGVDTIAGRSNMPNLSDSVKWALMTPLCHPSLGYSNGILYCAYTAFLRGNTQVVQDGSVLNAGEIFLTWSTDNGNTWVTPVNVTNTPNIEEKHPSLIRNFTRPAGDSVGVYYVRDMKAGGWVNQASWGPAPVYGIYKKLTGPIGIQQELGIVKEFKLFQNYPNPFNPTTTISYYIPKSTNVVLKVYNILGAEVATVVNGFEKAGAKEVTFNATGLASGIYYYTITAGDYKDTKKMVIVK